jgi:hypothetical protein
MIQPLPLKNFQRLNIEEIQNIDWYKTDKFSSTGYIVECDLEYPENIHEFHSDLPLCPQSLKIKDKHLSEFQKKLLSSMKQHGISRISTKKLILSLHDKKKYVTHYQNLKLYLNLGLKLRKVHRVLEFYQSNWLEKYIMLNTRLRENSTDKFEQDLFKLLNNAIFGKSCENVRKHVNIKLALNEFQAKNLVKRSFYEEFRIIDEDLAVFKMKKQSVLLNKPVVIGFSVLELSKLHMYHMHYNIFKKFYSDKLSLVYIDTDSFIYEIETDDIYEDFQEHFNEYLDTSNYPKQHFLYSEINKKKLGLMKDETAGQPILEFIGLKPKLYSIKFNNKNSISKCKGIQKAVVDKYITHQHFKKTLKGDRVFYSETRSIKSKNFNLRTIKQNKLTLSCFDDKRFIKDDLINTLPFGHKEIKHCI